MIPMRIAARMLSRLRSSRVTVPRKCLIRTKNRATRWHSRSMGRLKAKAFLRMTRGGILAHASRAASCWRMASVTQARSAMKIAPGASSPMRLSPAGLTQRQGKANRPAPRTDEGVDLCGEAAAGAAHAAIVLALFDGGPVLMNAHAPGIDHDDVSVVSVRHGVPRALQVAIARRDYRVWFEARNAWGCLARASRSENATRCRR